MADRIYTRGEKAQRARLLVKGARGAYGDVSRVEAQIERIDQAAEDRGRREAEAYERLLKTAKDELAAARVTERCAAREDRTEAREARKAAERRLRHVERARP